MKCRTLSKFPSQWVMTVMTPMTKNDSRCPHLAVTTIVATTTSYHIRGIYCFCGRDSTRSGCNLCGCGTGHLVATSSVEVVGLQPSWMWLKSPRGQGGVGEVDQWWLTHPSWPAFVVSHLLTTTRVSKILTVTNGGTNMFGWGRPERFSSVTPQIHLGS